ncbi:MAG: hypothetical protein JXR70_02030 [Spirochaetales bacterium]|nr:hypothetical protein [Spirochaetales bacterium]
MPEILQGVLISLASSTLITGLAVFIVKNYFKQQLKIEFEKKQHLLERTLKYDDLYTDEAMGLYPEVMEIANRIKNLVSEGLSKRIMAEWSVRIQSLTAILNEKLYKCRIIFPSDIFEEIHEFKHLAQDILLVYDILTREEFMLNDEAYTAKKPFLEKTYHQMEKRFSQFEKLVRNHIKRIRDC